jgi:hypothetical protein
MYGGNIMMFGGGYFGGPTFHEGYFAPFLMFFFMFFIVNLVQAFFAFWLAEQKNRKQTIWFILTLVFGFAALFTLGVAPNGEHKEKKEQ